jgi:hypothetical protein
MSIDGVWGFVYAGDTGDGIGIGGIVIKGGKFHGYDHGGVRYR